MILVTGATGNVGSQVVRELGRSGVPVRAFVRDTARAREVLGDAVELAAGNLSDPDSLRRALRGVDTVFLSSADGPEKVQQETCVIDAAVESGVEQIVKCSTIGAAVGSPLPPFDWHGRIEEHLRASGVPSVILRSCFYMTNLLTSADAVRTTGTLFAPAGDGRIAMIDPRDTGAAAAATLTEEGHESRTYELTGLEAISYSQVATALSRVTGSRIEFVDVSDEAASRELAASGQPAWLVEHLAALFPLIRRGALEPTTDTVRELTGRSPGTFEEFAHDHADAFAPGVVAGHR
jgi:uncharacterized protein YbjT (DUF2867 family)